MLALFLGLTAVRVGLAAWWALLADEAWYLAWAEQLALGYYDQPPAIAWVLAASTTVLGDSPLAVRAVPIACTLVVPAVLLSAAGDRSRWLLWCALVPALAWLGTFATPDALLLAAWAVALAGALRGGWGWWVAGLAAGFAFEAKHTGALLFPLLLLGLRPSPRDRDPWIGAAFALLLALPNLGWLATHDWVTVRFQLHEGLLHERDPGALGVFLQGVGQLGVATPILGLVGWSWVGLRARDALVGEERLLRVAWWTSAPLLVFFAVAAWFAPADAHWPAPAWIGIGLALSHERGPWERASWLGLGLAGILAAFLALHSLTPITRLPRDPATRLSEGPVLAAAMARIAAAEAEDSPDGTPAVYTERYQEAALLRQGTDIPAAVHPGCGRAGQQDLWGDPSPDARIGLYLRPRTGGAPTCLESRWRIVGPPLRLDLADPQGRDLGPWDVFRLEAR